MRQHQNGVRHAHPVDRLRVDVVDIVSSAQNSLHQCRSHILCHVRRQINITRPELRISIVVRKKHRYIIRWRALSQQIAHPLQILHDVRHHTPPRVVIVEHGSSIEGPSRLRYIRRRIGPAVPDKLIHSFKEKAVCLGFHIKWRGAERRRMKPRPGLGRGDGTPIQMTRRGSQARVRETVPLRSFPFRQRHKRIAG